MKTARVLLVCTLLATTTYGVAAQAPPAAGADGTVHRYLVERTFPAGALDKLDAALKAKVNATNSTLGVLLFMSYATPTKTKTYCVYDAPNEAAIRKAATV